VLTAGAVDCGALNANGDPDAGADCDGEVSFLLGSAALEAKENKLDGLAAEEARAAPRTGA
jgi:hypothetical protein